MNDVVFEINPIKDLENGQRFYVLTKLPMSIGWIEKLNLIIEKGRETLTFPLKHSKNENNYVYFEGVIDLETRAIYRYYFTYYANQELKFIKKENIVEDTKIIRDEKGKLSVNFNVPDWEKGKIMYHIFVDRYKRGSQDKLKVMPRRIIHHSFEEDVIVGPDEHGIWNNDFYGGDLKGITETLEYIKSLGVSIIYLSPIVSSQSNHRYDAADFSQVDPYAGCNDDLKKVAYISLIAVKPEYRRLGYGKKMLQHDIEYSKNKGMEKVRLEVRKDNEAAISYYQSLKFYFVDEEKLDSFYMECEI